MEYLSSSLDDNGDDSVDWVYNEDVFNCSVNEWKDADGLDKDACEWEQDGLEEYVWWCLFNWARLNFIITVTGWC